MKSNCYFKHICIELDDDCYQQCIIYQNIAQLISSIGIEFSDEFLKPLTAITENEVLGFKRLDEIKKNMKSFVVKGQNLLLTSNNLLTGKTSYSLRLMYHYFFEIYLDCELSRKGYFINIPEYIDKIESSYYRNSEEYRELTTILKTVDLVIWDDLIKYPLSSTVQASLGSLIESRIRNHKANIFNGLNVENLSEVLGKIITSNIELAEHINFDGESYKERMEIIRQHQKEVE